MPPPAPSYVQLFPTLRCGKACSFCFGRGLAAMDDMAVRDFGKLAEKLSSAGVTELDLLGGEPTLHPRLQALISTGIERGFTFLMSSNGDNVPALKSLTKTFGPPALRLGISLNDDDMAPALVDFIAAHKPVVKGVATRRRGMPPDLRRCLDLPGIEAYLIFLDVLSEDELADALTFQDYHGLLTELRRKHPDLGGVHCGFLVDSSLSPSLEEARCPAGTTKFSILPDGSVYPCYLLARDPAYRLGSIITDSFDQLWRSPVLKFFRTFKGNPCTRASCRFHSRCRGGCPAVSLMVTGDLNRPDPRCSVAA